MRIAPPSFAAIALAVASTLAAQTDSAARDPRAVQPERPTVATHAYTVIRGWLELEEGGEWDKFADGTRGFSAPTNVKIGLASNAQLNIMFSLIHEPLTPNGHVTVSDLTLGIKYRIALGAPILGDFAILPAIKLPTAIVNDGGTGTTDYSLLVISSRQLGPVEMDLNVGATRRTGDGSTVPTTASVWTASFGFPIDGALGGVFEVFGYPGTSGVAGQAGTAAILTGPTFLVRKWLAIDAGIIAPLTGAQAHAIYAGFVWNFGPVFRRWSRPVDRGAIRHPQNRSPKL